MVPGSNVGSELWARASARWVRLDRGWQAVLLGLAVVSLQWLRQAI